jgi:VWFA-related protein
LNTRHTFTHIALSAFAAAIPFTASAQSPAPSNPQLTVQTNLVLVPALVRNKSGANVYTLTAKDFLLTDDGTPQKLSLVQDTDHSPLALVIVLETGGAGAREFQNYSTLAPPLAPMLTSIVGNVFHQIAVVTFDSQPDLLQSFTGDTDEAIEALHSLQPGCTRQEHYDNCTGPQPVHNIPLGDNGAAILDSLTYAVDLLRTQPPIYRRAILLISETLDRGSTTTIQRAIRAIADTNTTIYSIGFSTGKSEAAHYAERQLPEHIDSRQKPGWLRLENPHPNPPHGCMGKRPDPDPDADPDATHNKWIQAYDCLTQLAPPLAFAKMAAIEAVDGMKTNIPETVARMTGGEYFHLSKPKELEGYLSTIANHVPNRYVLSFYPQNPHPGLHTLTLHTPNYTGLDITARATYWIDPPTTTPHHKTDGQQPR